MTEMTGRKKGSARMPERAGRGEVRGQFCPIAADVKPGRDVAIYNFVNLYGCEIGDNTRIGSFVEIQKGARIERDCKVSSHTFICEGVTVEDEVFIGHGVNFINDTYPRATLRDGTLQQEADWQVVPTRVRRVHRHGRNHPRGREYR